MMATLRRYRRVVWSLLTSEEVRREDFEKVKIANPLVAIHGSAYRRLFRFHAHMVGKVFVAPHNREGHAVPAYDPCTGRPFESW